MATIRGSLSSSHFPFPFSPQSIFHLSVSSSSPSLFHLSASSSSQSLFHLITSSSPKSPSTLVLPSPLISRPLHMHPSPFFLPLHPTHRIVPLCSLGSDAPHSTQYRGVERTRRTSPFSPPTLSNLLTPVHPNSTPISTRLAPRAYPLSTLLSPSTLFLHPPFHLPHPPSTSSPSRPVTSAPLRPACQPLTAAPHLLPPRHHSHPPQSPRLPPSTLHPPHPSPFPHPVPRGSRIVGLDLRTVFAARSASSVLQFFHHLSSILDTSSTPNLLAAACASRLTILVDSG